MQVCQQVGQGLRCSGWRASREGGRPVPAIGLSRRYLSRLRDGECRVNGQLVGVGTDTLKCGVVAVKHCRQRYCVLLGCLACCSC